MKPVNGVAQKASASGFSLIEMMVVLVIVSIVVAAVLTQVNQTQQRAAAEENKLDQFEDARNFVDQIAIDARQMGYPNIHNFDVSVTPAVAPTCGAATWQLPYIDDCRLAIGLVSISPTQLIFEGDVDGSGNVSIIGYTVNGDGACANCLERAQVSKQSVNGMGAAAFVNKDLNAVSGAYKAEIQNVQNVNSASNLIFRAYDSAGNALPATMDIGSDPTDIAKARTIQISLDISDPTKVDPKTHQPLEANIISRAQIVNCSMAGSATALAIPKTPGGIQLVCQP
jgi:prepilin-type N-terminal cleavage/methylation domain-containing protein